MPARPFLQSALFGFVLLAAGCRPATSDVAEHMASEFVYETLAFSPVAATQTGYHSHAGHRLDELLDDFSESGLNRQRDFYERFRIRLQSLDSGKLDGESRADVEIMRNQLELALLELNSIQSYRHNPTGYVELIGNGLFEPFVLEYAPKPVRFGHIISRLRAIPDFLKQARANLDKAPDVWIRVAIEENDGNIGLIDQTLRKECPPEQKQLFDAAVKGAIDALQAFNAYLKNDLSQHAADWRLGEDLYRRKFRYALGTERSPAEVLADAETQLKAVRDRMALVAGSEPVEKALDTIAKKHATPNTYFAEAQSDLAEATSFVRTHNFVALPQSAKSAGNPNPRVHARHLCRGRIFSSAGAGAQVGGILLDHADSEDMVRSANRVEAARERLLRVKDIDHSRGHARTLCAG